MLSEQLHARDTAERELLSKLRQWHAEAWALRAGLTPEAEKWILKILAAVLGLKRERGHCNIDNKITIESTVAKSSTPLPVARMKASKVASRKWKTLKAPRAGCISLD